MDKTEIINLSEASGVSSNDYVMIDSPTQGVRKYLASNFQSGSSTGGILRTTLFTASGGGGVWMDSAGKMIDLNDDIDNYDAIEIIAFTTEGDNDQHYTMAQIFMVTDMLDPSVSDANKGMPIEVIVNRTTGIDTSVLKLILISQSPAETPMRTLYCTGARGIYGAAIHKIVGIKYL